MGLRPPRTSSRLKWRGWVRRTTLVRHPVSPRRQRIGTALILAILLGCSYYYINTRDVAIRSRVLAYLHEVTTGEVEIGRAQFSLFGGITLYDVHLAVPFNRELDSSAVDFNSREIFSASSLHVEHSPWRLLFGSLRIDRIVATQPTITLTQNVDTGLRNWRILFAERMPRESSGPAHRPQIILRMARVDVVSIDADGRHEARTEEMDADVRPHPQIPTAYCIEVRRFSNPVERTTVILDPDDRRLANTPFVDVNLLNLQLPKLYQQFFRRIRLQGQVKLSRLSYGGADEADSRDDEVELRNVWCAIPAAMWRTSGAATAPASDTIDEDVAMTEVNGVMRLRGERLEVALSGRVNGAVCRVNGHFSEIDRDFSEIGMNVSVECERLPMPEGSIRHRIAADPAIAKDIRHFLGEYDPHGLFDISCELKRAAGPGAKPVFSAVINPQGANASHYAFPYRVTDLYGRVRIESDRIVFDDLNGYHGAGHIRFNGYADRTTLHPAVDMVFSGDAVPLDLELYQALKDNYRTIWERFNPRGSTDCVVRLSCEGNNGAYNPPWQVRIDADLVDARFLFRQFPYALDDVFGHMTIQDDRIVFSGLTGRNGEASVRIDGYAALDLHAAPEVELRVEARRMNIDEKLTAALPREAREALEQFQAKGKVDLLGSVSMHEGDESLVYDLTADLYDAQLCYVSFPVPLEGVRGRFHIRPEGIVVMQAEGRHGTARLSANGELRHLPDGHAADLRFECRDLSLDRAVYASLPGAVRSIWDRFEPTGRCNIATQVHLEQRDGRDNFRHRTSLELVDGTLICSAFPVALREATGRALITERGVEIESLRGRSVGGTIEITGDIDLIAPGVRGTLQVDARDCFFEPDLMQALPPGLSRTLAAMRPHGRFDLRLDALRFDTDASGKTLWDFDGVLAPQGVRAHIGFDMRHAKGTVAGRGRVRRDGNASLHARAQLERVRLGAWRLENLDAVIVMDEASNRLRVEDAVADIYGGKAAGYAEVIFGDTESEYRASIDIRDAELARYLASGKPRPPDHQRRTSEPARGLLFGNMFVRGRTGSRRFHEGGGEVFLREAEVWRLPLAMSIFQVLNLTPDENVFHDGWLKFYMTRSTLTLQKIDLQGKAMSFIGGGRMDLDTGELDVVLLAGSPVRITVPFLTEILEGASREVMEVRIRGTVAQPKIKPQPLKSLKRALETLFPPDQPSQAGTGWRAVDQ